MKKEATIEGYPVKTALVHQPATIRGMTETSFHAAKGYDMVYKTDGLHVVFKDERFIIPLSNIILVILEKTNG